MPPAGASKTHTMLCMDAGPGIYLQMLTDLFQAIEETHDSTDCSVSMSYLEVSRPPPRLPCLQNGPDHECKTPPVTETSGHPRLLWRCKAPVIGKPLYFCIRPTAFSVSVSSQIYNEVIWDLLNPSSGFLDLRKDSRGSIQIAGITEVSTSNTQEVRVTGAHGRTCGSSTAAMLTSAHRAEPDTGLQSCFRAKGTADFCTTSPLSSPVLRADITNGSRTLPSASRRRWGFFFGSTPGSRSRSRLQV